MRTWYDWIRFALEQFISRGPLQHLLVIAGLILGISLVAGFAVMLGGEFVAASEAIWWAFLRLTDPGYLGDDHGTFRRFVSTILTVLGYVVFLGALVAIMTQWFHAMMARINSGTSPVRMQDHIVVLGWTNRTLSIVTELLVSETRVTRFYQKLGSRSGLRIVILSQSDVTRVRATLRARLGHQYDPDIIIVRSGTPMRASDLQLVDFLHAAAIIIPADTENVEAPNLDAVTIKTLLSTTYAARELANGDTVVSLPLAVAELTDDRKVPIADAAYAGPIETLSTDRILARLIAHTVRHPRVTAVYKDLLGHSFGNEVYARHWHGPPTPFRAVVGSYRHAIPFGMARGEDGHLEITMNPSLDTVVREGDRVVLLAPNLPATDPAGSDSGIFAEVQVTQAASRRAIPAHRRLLLLGWSRKIPTLLAELDAYEDQAFSVDVVSLVPLDERARGPERFERTRVTHIVADYTSESELEALELPAYDRVLFLANDWLHADQMADARTLLGYLVLQRAMQRHNLDIPLIVELRDPVSEDLIPGHEDDVLVGPEMISHMLTHIALRRELGEIFEEVFGPHGTEIFFNPASSYGLTGRWTFTDIRRHVATHGDCALGVRVGGEVVLNPPWDDKVDLGKHDEIIVLATYWAANDEVDAAN